LEKSCEHQKVVFSLYSIKVKVKKIIC